LKEEEEDEEEEILPVKPWIKTWITTGKEKIRKNRKFVNFL
jgi:hypothetical protein